MEVEGETGEAVLLFTTLPSSRFPLRATQILRPSGGSLQKLTSQRQKKNNPLQRHRLQLRKHIQETIMKQSLKILPWVNLLKDRGQERGPDREGVEMERAGVFLD